jgi:hypothetical protein
MREFRDKMLAAIKNQHNYWSKHYKSAVLADSGVYNDGKILGNELIPTLNIAVGWNLLGTATVNDSNTFTTTSNSGIVWDNLIVGKKYIINASITTTAAFCELYNSNIGAFNFITKGTAFTAISTGLYIRNTGAGTTDINSISVKEVLTDSITTGYYKMSQLNNMYKPIQFGWLGEAGIKNASNRISKAYTLAYGGERLGSELVVNQDDREFTNPSTTFWSKRGNATISGGFGNIVNGTAFQDGFEMTVIAGKKYK